MAKSFEFSLDVTKLMRDMEEAADVIDHAIVDGMHEVTDEWRIRSTNLAPLYQRKGPKDKRPSGALRSSIFTDVKNDGNTVTGEIHAVAIEVNDGKRFNYAYYLHEVYSEKHGKSFKNPSTAGTIPDFLDRPLEERKERWIKDIEAEISRQLKARGW